MDNKGPIDNKTVEAAVVEAQVENAKVENLTNAGPETVVSKGEQRFNQIAETMSNAKSKVSGWFSKGAAGLGRLFKSGAIGVLNSPETTVAGVKFVGEKIGDEAGYIRDSVATGASFVGEKVVGGIKSVGDDINQFDKYTSAKAEQLGVWAGKGMASVYETTSGGMNKAKNYSVEKVNQAGNYLKDKAATAEAVGSLIMDKTTTKLTAAKEGIVKNYDGAVKYGRDAIDTATLRAWYAKDAFNEKMNAWKKSVLEKKAEIQAEKLQQTLSKLAQYNKVAQMGNNLEAQAA